MPYPSKKFRQNPFTSLRVIRRTDRQRDRQTDKQTNRPHQKHNLRRKSAEVIMYTNYYIVFTDSVRDIAVKVFRPTTNG